MIFLALNIFWNYLWVSIIPKQIKKWSVIIFSYIYTTFCSFWKVLHSLSYLLSKIKHTKHLWCVLLSFLKMRKWTKEALNRPRVTHMICEEIVTKHGEGNDTPLQYSCLENPMDRGAWWAAVHEVAKSRTWLSDFTLTFHFMHWRRKWQPTPVFLPGESQGWGSLVGCHLWGLTESDTTEAT